MAVCHFISYGAQAPVLEIFDAGTHKRKAGTISKARRESSRRYRKEQKMQADQILKEFWEDNERFADFFNTVFFGGRKLVSPEELETISPDMSDAEETKRGLEGITKYRDKVKLWHGIRLAILGIENQNKIHYAMPERAMLFDALQYESQRKRIAAVRKKKEGLTGEEYLSRFTKNDR